jgi:oxygen-independent coproporphyrinogen-3 oxidase
VHIPFCARICPYCDFAVVAGKDASTDRYLAALAAEIEAEPGWRPLDAVSVGGGTPSRLTAGQLAAVLATLAGRFGLATGAEVGLEANPEDWTDEKAESLVAAGFTRVSFGAQSFDPVVLAALGRAHRPADVDRAVTGARRAGFASVNLDLIFGAPAESAASWRATVERALALEPDHLSTYALTVERGTELGRAVRAGAPAPDPDVQADRWEEARALMAEAGLVGYEVSNAARPGHACRYNLSVWAHGEYLGFGAGAHGYRAGSRRRNVRRLEAYMERVESGVGPVQGAEPVEGWAAEAERLMLGMRLAAGVPLGAGGAALLASEEGARLLEAGVVAVEAGRVRVRRPLLTDAAVRAVLSLPPPER